MPLDEQPGNLAADPPPVRHAGAIKPTTVRTSGGLRPSQVAVLVVAMLLAALFLIVVLLFRFLSNPFLDYACSTPGQRALASQEETVRSHLADASDFEVATYDCEDGGSAHLAFSTDLDPRTARDVVLTDPACLPYRGGTVGDTAAVCGKGSKVTYWFCDTASDGTTSGELQLDR